MNRLYNGWFFTACGILISLVTMATVACPPPDCPDCMEWYETGGYCIMASGAECAPDWYYAECCECEDCQIVSYGCSGIGGCSRGCLSSCNCQYCYCWEPWDGITGTISVANTCVLCDRVMHSVSVLDYDRYWYPWGSSWYEASAGDTLTYCWSKTGGTWDSVTNSNSVYWIAPPCIGTVGISVTVDDVPNEAFNGCAGSNRDDDSRVFSGTVAVTLPAGCTTGTKQAYLSATKVGSTGLSCSNPNACGSTMIGWGTVVPAMIAVYNDCSWVFQVVADLDVPCGPCPSHYTEVSWPINTSVVTASNYCGIVNSYWNENGCGTGYSTSTCVQIHEDNHYSRFYSYLTNDAKQWLLNKPSMTMAIDCSQSYTHTCDSARAARQGTITSDVQMAYWLAWYSSSDEGPAIAAARSCFREYAEQICHEASARGWPSCSYCP